MHLLGVKSSCSEFAFSPSVLLRSLGGTPVSDSAEGCVLFNSEMHHFRSFGDYEFRTNLKSRYRSIDNLVKITQERALLIKYRMICCDFSNNDRQNLIFCLKDSPGREQKIWYLLKQRILLNSELF